MTYLAAIFFLIAVHYRRAYIRQANRASALRQTVDALNQERWESEVAQSLRESMRPVLLGVSDN